MTEEDYIAQRLDDQISWYDARSVSSRRTFKRLRFLEITAAALVPLLTGFSDDLPALQYAIGGLGLGVAVTAGWLGVGKYEEHWTEYRTTCESLKHEKFMYMTKVEPYDVNDPFPLFVQRVERLISKEHSNWAQSVRSKDQEDTDGQA